MVIVWRELLLFVNSCSSFLDRFLNFAIGKRVHSAFEHLGAVVEEVKIAFKTMEDDRDASGRPILERHSRSD